MQSDPLTKAETAELRRLLDRALPVARNPERDIKDHDWPITDLCRVVFDLRDAGVSTPDQLSILYDVLDYLADEHDGCSETSRTEAQEEGNELCPYNQALLMLGRHVMAERRAAKAASATAGRRLDS